MKKLVLATLIASLGAVAAPVMADDGLSFNVGAVSDYRYRGISQTRLKPALQGGADFTAGGFYVGTWASTIKWIKDARGDAGVEVDIYGGYKGEITKELGFDVGVLNYWYPSAVTPGWAATPYSNPNTTEIYGALTYGPVTAKYSHAVTNLFGNPNSKNSYYLDLTGNFEIAKGLTLTAHVGRQEIKNTANASYTDYSLGLGGEVLGLAWTASYVGTDANKGFYVPGALANSTKFLGKDALVVGIKKSF
ncbi:hypothetical protein IP84_03045 [beta proteobacterium AAP99]|nr:hypothetical protein IP84_03045 [beta proteobacterium AAP99]